jgi:hypothetical protein
MLTREQIIAAITERRRETLTVNVPEWGGDLAVARMSVEDLERTGLDSGERTVAVMTRVIATCLVGDDGERLFTDEQAADIAQGEIDVVARVFAKCLEVNGLISEKLAEAMQGFAAAQPDA